MREEARAAKHVNAKQAHSKQPGPLRLLHLMRSCDPEKKPDIILLIPGSKKKLPSARYFDRLGWLSEAILAVTSFQPLAIFLLPCELEQYIN